MQTLQRWDGTGAVPRGQVFLLARVGRVDPVLLQVEQARRMRLCGHSPLFPLLPSPVFLPDSSDHRVRVACHGNGDGGGRHGGPDRNMESARPISQTIRP